MAALAGVVLVLLLGNAGCNKQTTEAPGGEKLTLYAPSNQTLTAGGDPNPIDVSIKREKFNEPVTVKFDDLPKGVTVQETDMTIAKDKEKTTFNLKAAADAPEVTDHPVKVTVTGPKSLTAEQKFKVTVKKKT